MIIVIGVVLAFIQSENALYTITASFLGVLYLFSTAAILRLLVDIALSLK
ncbi:MAG: hypothetical protein M0Q19_07245 [Candidatus Cloacimonetes bacterium]|jgi:hypothetical protein|nr:hypothetical protein [Candidatus Cloacimonadota bacterium]MCB5279559.1 hypothetical protein [Candidatus Cloacimonadota bacterium]MCK9332954.1 hypothetical protein [Candidatus Cloacimonadota bacterium]MDY0299804.1 hypothetical protein [Candidatus Cloacimonadaceae bacterium]